MIQFPRFSVFIGQKSIFRRYCIQNVKDGIQIQVHNINNESVNHFSQFISVKVKKNLRKSLAEFRVKLRKLRLRQNDGFLIKKRILSKGKFTMDATRRDPSHYDANQIWLVGISAMRTHRVFSWMRHDASEMKKSIFDATRCFRKIDKVSKVGQI